MVKLQCPVAPVVTTISINLAPTEFGKPSVKNRTVIYYLSKYGFQNTDFPVLETFKCHLKTRPFS